MKEGFYKNQVNFFANLIKIIKIKSFRDPPEKELLS